MPRLFLSQTLDGTAQIMRAHHEQLQPQLEAMDPQQNLEAFVRKSLQACPARVPGCAGRVHIWPESVPY
eukprot:COSAG01_NODE_2109_length_8408_cov_33.352870_9_plen_69_part_00